jgi:hypothetical protein
MSETTYAAEGERSPKKDDRNLRPGAPELEYDDSDTSSEILTGVSKVEAAQAVWYVS